MEHYLNPRSYDQDPSPTQHLSVDPDDSNIQNTLATSLSQTSAEESTFRIDAISIPARNTPFFPLLHDFEENRGDQNQYAHIADGTKALTNAGVHGVVVHPEYISTQVLPSSPIIHPLGIPKIPHVVSHSPSPMLTRFPQKLPQEIGDDFSLDNATGSYAQQLPPPPVDYGDSDVFQASQPATCSRQLAPKFASRIANHAPMVLGKQSSRAKVREYTFVSEDPSRKLPTIALRARNINFDNDYSRRLWEEERLHKEAMKKAGGSCIWCNQMKKRCDPSKCCSPCRRRGWPCFRSYDQIWLYVAPLYTFGKIKPSERDRSKVLEAAKLKTFEKAYELCRKLHSKLQSPIPQGNAILQCRWRYPNPSGLVVLDSSLLHDPLEEYQLPEDDKETLIRTVLSIVPEPKLFKENNTSESPTILGISMKMLGLAAFIISTTRGQPFARQTDIPHGQIVLLYLLTYLVQILVQLSDDFSLELFRLLRQKRNRKPVLDDAFLATGLYYRVLSALHYFAPGPDSMIDVILFGVKKQLGPVISLIETLLRSDFLATNYIQGYLGLASSAKEKNFWMYFDRRVPPLPILDDMQISLYFYEKTSFPVPTALHRNFQPFSFPYLSTISELMSSEYNEISDFQTAENRPMPGPDVVSFTTRPLNDQFITHATALGIWAEPVLFDDNVTGEQKDIILHGLDAEGIYSQSSVSRNPTQTESIPSEKVGSNAQDEGEAPTTYSPDPFFDYQKYFDHDGGTSGPE
ncbi:hypothetical protein DIZ76_011154 [Coccidioides immitis]|nr:hypothetical protein DIZ76_011154 [Coccidioides immitis]